MFIECLLRSGNSAGNYMVISSDLCNQLAKILLSSSWLYNEKIDLHQAIWLGRYGSDHGVRGDLWNLWLLTLELSFPSLYRTAFLISSKLHFLLKLTSVFQMSFVSTLCCYPWGQVQFLYFSENSFVLFYLIYKLWNIAYFSFSFWNKFKLTEKFMEQYKKFLEFLFKFHQP